MLDLSARRLSLVVIAARQARHGPTLDRSHLLRGAAFGPLVVSPYGNHTRPTRSRAEPLRGRLRRALAPDRAGRD